MSQHRSSSNRNKPSKRVVECFTDAELRTILHYMAVALRHGRGAFRPVEKFCCREHEDWIPVLRKVECFLGISSSPVNSSDKGGRK